MWYVQTMEYYLEIKKTGNDHPVNSSTSDNSLMMSSLTYDAQDILHGRVKR